MDFFTNISVFMLISGMLGITIQPLLIRFAALTRCYDTPDKRKVHQTAISALGGIGIYLSVWFSFVWGFGIDKLEWQVFFVASAVLFSMSLIDDIKPIAASIKLLIQIGLGLALCQAGLVFHIDYLLGFSLPFQHLINVSGTLFFIVLMLNAVNFMDGINGLAGTLCLSQILWLSCILFAIGLFQWAAFGLLLVPAILGFLRYNFGTAKIFMGDNGSTFLGLTIAVLVIQLWNHLSLMPQGQYFILSMLFVIALPIVDLFKVVLGRILRGKSPFSPDRTHLHHLMLKAGFSCEKICWSVGLFMILNLLATFIIGLENQVVVGLMYTTNIVLFYRYIYRRVEFVRISKIKKQLLSGLPNLHQLNYVYK